MTSKAAITVMRPREEVERRWRDPGMVLSHIREADTSIRFVDAPGDRGTEIHVELRTEAPAGKLGETVQKLTGMAPLARIKDDLRHFKQLVETGIIARSEASPEGESAVGKFRERPGQPLTEAELQKVGV
jgi:uncharacterized membrane protein